MKFSSFAAGVAAAWTTTTSAFSPATIPHRRTGTELRSTLEEARAQPQPQEEDEEEELAPAMFQERSSSSSSLPFLLFQEPAHEDRDRDDDDDEDELSPQRQGVSRPLSGAEYNERLAKQLEKLRSKDRTSIRMNKEDLKIVYEDDHIVVVNKPSGVLTVPGKDPSNPSLAQTAHEHIPNSLATADHMVVHRLGMDTSGVIVLAKDMAAVRGMNTVFRTRKIERHYEALVLGRVGRSEGLISLPLMRDYECPPYQRISTDDHQVALLDLEPEEVGKKILEGPKKSITHYRVLSREEFHGEQVTRVALTSFTGRYHQLNVHLAAFGHPILGDAVYGYGGEAMPNGGLTEDELESLVPNPLRVDEATQRRVAELARRHNILPCVHAKSLKFRHPVTKETVELTSEAPF